MKTSVILLGLLGLAVAIGLVVYFGAGGVLSAVSAIGWGGFALFVAWAMLVFIPLGLAWFVLAPGLGSRRLMLFIWGRQVREAAADVLPFSPIGGMVIGARAVVLGGVDTATVNASLAVDLVTEIIAQLVFMVMGIGLLAGRLSRASLADDPLILLVIGGLALMIAGAVTFIAAQRRGMGALGRLLQKRLPSVAGQMQGVEQAMAAIYAQPKRLALSTVLHAIAWYAAAFGSWLALRFMGVHLSILSVVAIESLVSALKSAAFFVPNAAGVQEGSFALVGGLFGLAPETAIALSLLRRARDLTIGAPTLVVWQAIEGRRLLLKSNPGATGSALEHRS